MFFFVENHGADVRRVPEPLDVRSAPVRLVAQQIVEPSTTTPSRTTTSARNCAARSIRCCVATFGAPTGSTSRSMERIARHRRPTADRSRLPSATDGFVPPRDGKRQPARTPRSGSANGEAACLDGADAARVLARGPAPPPGIPTSPQRRGGGFASSWRPGRSGQRSRLDPRPRARRRTPECTALGPGPGGDARSSGTTAGRVPRFCGHRLCNDRRDRVGSPASFCAGDR